MSMVTASAAEALLKFPAASVVLAVMLCTPSKRADAVIVQAPVAVETALPIAVVPSYRTTVVEAGAVPLKIGVVILVMLSVDDLPLSVSVVRSGVEGTVGAAVSMVTDSDADTALTLPARSVSAAATLCTPLVSGVVAVTDQDLMRAGDDLHRIGRQ